MASGGKKLKTCYTGGMPGDEDNRRGSQLAPAELIRGIVALKLRVHLDVLHASEH